MTRRYVLLAALVLSIGTVGGVYAVQSEDSCGEYERSQTDRFASFEEQQSTKAGLLAECMREQDQSSGR